MLQCYAQHVSWKTQQYNQVTYLRPVDSNLVNTKSTQRDSISAIIVLPDSTSDELNGVDSHTCARMEGFRIVTLVTLHKRLIVHDTDHDVQYIPK